MGLDGNMKNALLLMKFLLFSSRHKAEADFWPPRKKVTSNQINQQRRKNQTDYENLLLLQKIQNAKPSKTVAKGFGPASISAAHQQAG